MHRGRPANSEHGSVVRTVWPHTPSLLRIVPEPVAIRHIWAIGPRRRQRHPGTAVARKSETQWSAGLARICVNITLRSTDAPHAPPRVHTTLLCLRLPSDQRAGSLPDGVLAVGLPVVVIPALCRCPCSFSQSLPFIVLCCVVLQQAASSSATSSAASRAPCADAAALRSHPALTRFCRPLSISSYRLSTSVHPTLPLIRQISTIGLPPVTQLCRFILPFACLKSAAILPLSPISTHFYRSSAPFHPVSHSLPRFYYTSIRFCYCSATLTSWSAESLPRFCSVLPIFSLFMAARAGGDLRAERR